MIPGFYTPPILDRKEAEEWDKYSILTKGVNSELLMGWAGYSIFIHLAQDPRFINANTVHLLAGPGNNGGDGYVLLWHILSAFDKNVVIWTYKPPKTEDAKYFYDLCLSLQNIKNIQIKSLDELQNETALSAFQSKDILIDALFGTGLNKPPYENIQQVFQNLNNLTNALDVYKIAIDMPSGVYADGDDFTHTVFKTHTTYTFGSYKIGHLIEPGILFSGRVIVFPIGFFPIKNFIENLQTELGENISRRRLIQKVSMPPLRKANGHKYTSGVVTVIGGSLAMEGAAIMAARSFLALGGGLARIVSPSLAMTKALNHTPELMVHTEESITNLEKKVLEVINEKKHVQAAVLGVGLRETLSGEFWKKIMEADHLHLVIDGSALASLYPIRDILQNHCLKSLTLTPHKGEAQMLLNKKISNIRKDALEISQLYNANVYFKGPGGVLILKNETTSEEIYINSNHYELATGGTGDVLSGVLSNTLLRFSMIDKSGAQNGAQQGLEAGLYSYLEAANEYVKKEGTKPDQTKSLLEKDFLEPSGLIKQLKQTWSENK